MRKLSSVGNVEEASKELALRPVQAYVVRSIPLTKEVTCITCKCLIIDGTINYVRGPYDVQNMKSVIAPCPTCSADMHNRLEAQKQAERIAEIFGGAQIPFRARNWDFGNYPKDADKKALMMVKTFTSRHLQGDTENKRMFYLGGATGRCKTSLALCSLKEALKAGYSGLFIMTTELMQKLRSCYNTNADYSQDEMLSAVTSVQWLVLDDLAVEKPTAWVLEQMYYIIQKRADKGLYTIITSNLSLKDVEKYWRPDGTPEGEFHPGLRIVERLKEFCEGCSVTGRNQRQVDW